jgi:Fur family transcriptional regulator, ferric uptake regulator
MSADPLTAALRDRGLRATPQRRAVLDAVDALGHATAEQVAVHVDRGIGEDVSLATVYRTLELLEDLGLVTHAHLEHGAPTYHSTRRQEHLHLVCRECGAVDEADAAHGHALARAIRAERGFATDVRHLALHGTCRRCAAVESAAAPRTLEQT